MIFPDGFGPLLPCETGIAPGTVTGRIAGEDSIEEFLYEKTILRTFGPSATVLRGSWDIQIVENGDPAARIWFDSSVDIGLLMVGAGDPLFGSIGYFDASYVSDFGLGPGKFKTRIVGGEFVPPVIEDYSGPPDPTPPAGSPAPPSWPRLSTLKQTSIDVFMPPLPDGADTLSLLASASQNGPYDTLYTGLHPNDRKRVQVADVPGAASPSAIWFRVAAVNQHGTSYGPRVRDADTAISGVTQTAGYQGWRYIGGETVNPTVFSEGAREWTPETGAQVTAGSGQFIGTWTSPAYKCPNPIPAGSLLLISSDAWVPSAVIQDKYTFSVSYKPGVSSVSEQDPRLGKTWRLYPSSGAVLIGESRRREGYLLNTNNSKVFEFTPISLSLSRYGGFLIALAGHSSGADLAYSWDDGKTWTRVSSGTGGDTQTVLIKDTRVLATCATENAETVVIGKASATDTENTDPRTQILGGDLVVCVLSANSDPQRGGDFVMTRRQKINAVSGSQLPSSGSLFVSRYAGVYNVIQQDGNSVRLWTSEDELQTLKEVQSGQAEEN